MLQHFDLDTEPLSPAELEDKVLDMLAVSKARDMLAVGKAVGVSGDKAAADETLSIGMNHLYMYENMICSKQCYQLLRTLIIIYAIDTCFHAGNAH